MSFGFQILSLTEDHDFGVLYFHHFKLTGAFLDLRRGIIFNKELFEESEKSLCDRDNKSDSKSDTERDVCEPKPCCKLIYKKVKCELNEVYFT